MRKLLQPSNNKQDRIYPPPKTNSFFQYGVIKDAPASDIPNPGALADAFNTINYPTEVQGRTGSRLYTELSIPPIAGKTGFSATKVGDIITATAWIFDYSDVGNFFVWPGEIEQHDEILERIDGQTVRVATRGNITSPIIGCYIRGKNNAHFFHKQRKRWMRQFYKCFYNSDLAYTSWDESIIVSRDLPNNTKSGYASFDEYSGTFFKSGGIFHVDMEITPSIAYRINCPIPDVAINGNREDSLPFAVRYRYSVARLAGNQTLRTRLDPI